jgi:hypothetical protein
MTATFQDSFIEARSRYGSGMWDMLSPIEQTCAIYRELRRIDLGDETVRDRRLE